MTAALAMPQTSPWDITRPTVLSVSGGRTSMYMLRRYLDHHGGALPEFAVAVFCNTGREHPKTLDFVQRCSTEWGCPIVWLEYQDADAPADRWRVVSHNSASRDGEPYAALNRRKAYLPNQVARTCTQELKTNLVHRWAIACWPWGQSAYTKAIGYRADEPHRIRKALDRCAKKPEPWQTVWPLADDCVTKTRILDWWRHQPFDLEIHEDEGNCVLCFLKSRWKLAANIERNPVRADWWIEQERLIGGTFRPPSRAYASFADLKRWALSDAPKPWKQGDMLGNLDALDLECSCTD